MTQFYDPVFISAMQLDIEPMPLDDFKDLSSRMLEKNQKTQHSKGSAGMFER